MSETKDQWCSCTRLREAEEKAAEYDRMRENFLKEVHDWALFGLEGCDENEWRLFNSILGAIARYRRNA